MFKTFRFAFAMALAGFAAAPASAVLFSMETPGDWVEVDRRWAPLPCEENPQCFFPGNVRFNLEISDDFLPDLRWVSIDIWVYGLSYEYGTYKVWNRRTGDEIANGGPERPDWLISMTTGTYAAHGSLDFNGVGKLRDWDNNIDSCDESEYMLSSRELTEYIEDLGGCDEPTYRFEYLGQPTWNVPVTVPIPAGVALLAGGVAALGALKRRPDRRN